MAFKEPNPRPADSTAHCDVCDHLNLAFQAMLEYHAISRARYEEAMLAGNTIDALALEAELANSSEPIRRAAKELRDHEANHSRAGVRTKDRILRLVKPKTTDDVESFFPDTAGSA